MKRLLAVLLILVLIIGALWFLYRPVKAPVGSALTDYLGTDTLVFAELHKPFDLYKRHPARPFLEELAKINWPEEMKSVLPPDSTTNLEIFSESWKEMRSVLREIPSEELFGREVILAAGGPQPRGIVLLSRIPGETGERAFTRFREVLRKVREKYPWITLDEEEEADTGTFTFSQIPGRPFHLYFRRAGELLLLATDEAEFKKMTARLTGSIPEDALIKSATFSRLVHPEAPKEPDVRFYLNNKVMAGFWADFGNRMDIPLDGLSNLPLDASDDSFFPAIDPAGIEGYKNLIVQILDVLFLEKARSPQSVLLTGKVDEDGSITRFACVDEKQSAVPTPAAGAGGAARDFIRFVPENAVSFSYNSQAGMLDTYERIVKILEESEAGAGMLAGLRDWEKEKGIDLRRDLLVWQSGGMGWVALSSSKPDLLLSGIGRRAIFLSTHDEESARIGLDKLLRAVSESYGLSAKKIKDYTVLGMPLGGVSLAVTVRDGYAIAALGADPTETLDLILTQRDPKSVFSSEKWQGMEALLDKDIAEMSFTDTASRWNGLAQMGLSLALANMFISTQISDPEMQARVMGSLSLLQTVLPAFKKLAIMDAEGRVSWKEDGRQVEIMRIKAAQPKKQATPRPAGSVN